MKIGICKLCLEEKPLVSKSHIIPKSFLKDFYDENKKLRKFSPQKIANGINRIDKPSDGLYQKSILCKNCEDFLNKNYENYALSVFYNTGNLSLNQKPIVKILQENEFRIEEYSNIDYTKMKLFFLSILWRASVSNLTCFNSVSLGPHEEILRNMVKNKTVTKEDEYTILVYRLYNVPDMVVDPRKGKMGKHTTYSFVLKDFVCQIFITTPNNKVKINPEKNGFLSEKGTIKIMTSPKFGWNHFNLLTGLN